MIRTLRAFGWLRWRMFVNSLERTGARDTIERFSIAVENLGPIMAGVLMVPSGLALAALAAAAGYALAAGNDQSILIQIVRFILLAVPVLCIVGPLFLPAADRTNPIRLLLLPISRSTMYVAQSGSAFGDPWILLTLPIVICLPLGLFAGGAFTGALVSVVAGAALVATVVGLSSLATSVIHLAVRDRRRGELLALLFIVIVPMLSMMPGLIAGGNRPRDAQGRRLPRTRVEPRAPTWVDRAAERGFSVVPTELYVKSTRDSATQNVSGAAKALAALGATAAILHAFGLFVFGKVLDSPGSTGARRTAPMRAAWGRTLPFLSPAASAVATAQLRLALRSPRGRATLMTPLIFLVIFGVMMKRGGGGMDFGPFSFQSGLSLASFMLFFSLLSILPIAMNQFAVDNAGLTMALLSPLTDREYLQGKAVGNALITGLPALAGIILIALVFPGGSPALWLCLPLAYVAISLLVAPVAAMASATFPRVVDMNSIGRGSNAHGLAGLVGILSFVGAGAPCLLLVLLATRWLERPLLAPVFLLAWCGVAFIFSRLLFVVSRKVFDKRRENFAMMM
jgi:hypothetical protein